MAETPVDDRAGRLVGEVEAVELDHASRRITRVIVRKGRGARAEARIAAIVGHGREVDHVEGRLT